VAVLGVLLLSLTFYLRQQPSPANLPPAVSRTNTAPAALPRPRLPAPKIEPVPVPAPPAPTAAGPATTTNLLSRQATGSFPKLTPEQVEAYLAAHGRTAATLLAAFQASGNAALLKEAMEKFPGDPHVAFTAALSANLKPGEQRAWLEAFKKSAPDNALPTFLSALGYFNAGQSDQAVEELLVAASQRQFQNYSSGSGREVEQLYRSAGYSEAEARMFAAFGQTLPEASSLRTLAQDIVRLADGYRQGGDADSAQAALLLSAVVGQSYGESSNFIITRLTGFAMETTALMALDPNTIYGNSGQTIQNRLDEIARQKTLIRELTQQTAPLLDTLSDQDWVAYLNRVQSAGEIAALQWLATRPRTP
jgi:hypothetical protein